MQTKESTLRESDLHTTGWSRIIGTETRGCLEALAWMYKKIVL